MENIKDGQATASKYNNDNIHFKTPNTVIIFSNQLPDTTKLSKDRWNILEIKGNELHNIKRKQKKMTSEEKDKTRIQIVTDSDSNGIVSGLYG